MPYIGKIPAIGNYQVLDAITASATATYALTKNSVAVFPQTPANCIVSLNGVIQAPFDSYTISGSNIVFASALTVSDSIDFITVLGDVLNVGTVSDGTIGLAKLSATGTKDATTFLRGDNTFQTIGANTPSFLVNNTVTTNQGALSSGVDTKVTFNNVDHDTNSGWDAGNNKWVVPSGQAGKYVIFAGLGGYTGSNDLSRFQLLLRVNGSNIYTQTHETPNKRHSEHSVAVIKTLSVGDYIELYGNAVATSPYFRRDFKSNWLGAYKLIE